MSSSRGLQLAVLLVAAAGAIAFAQQPSPAPLETLHVQNNIHAIFGAGGNVSVQTGPEGVLVVDSGTTASATALLAEIRKLSSGPIRFLINTHVHPDHTGGNVAFSRTATDPFEPLNIMAHERVLSRMSAALPAFQPGQTVGGAERLRGLPIDEYFTPTKDLRFNNEAVVLYHENNAHTDGDTVVLFRGSDVVSTGDVFTPDAYPFIDVANGGTIQGEIAALNHILQLTVPGHTQEGGTYVIPGHGRLCDEADVVEFRDMLVIVRDRVRDMIKRNMTLDQIKAARPTRDYDPGYVTPTSFVKADQFVEAVYRGLNGQK